MLHKIILKSFFSERCGCERSICTAAHDAPIMSLHVLNEMHFPYSAMNRPNHPLIHPY